MRRPQKPALSETISRRPSRGWAVRASWFRALAQICDRLLSAPRSQHAQTQRPRDRRRGKSRAVQGAQPGFDCVASRECADFWRSRPPTVIPTGILTGDYRALIMNGCMAFMAGLETLAGHTDYRQILAHTHTSFLACCSERPENASRSRTSSQLRLWPLQVRLSLQVVLSVPRNTASLSLLPIDRAPFPFH